MTATVGNIDEVKIIFNRHDGFYLPREEFIKHTNMQDKEQVGYLSNEYKFLLILVSLAKKEYHLVGCRSEDKARRLLAAIALANRYQELISESRRMGYPLNPYYLEYVVNLCNLDDVQFVIKPSMVANDREELFIKHFMSKGEFIESLLVENFEMKDLELEKVAMVIISVPQQQIMKLMITNCKITDDLMSNFGRALRHNSYLKILTLDKLQITDKSLKFFSGLWQYIPFLDELKITGCKQLKGEQYLAGFLNSITTSLNLKLLDLSRNSFSEINTSVLVEELINVKNLLIAKIDLSYNCFTSRDNWTLYQYYLKSPIKDSTELILAPYPIHEDYFSAITQSKKFSTIVFERISLTGDEKRKVLTNEDLAICREIAEEVNQCVLFQKTIEDIQTVCRNIKVLDFDFPPQYTERLSELVRELVVSSSMAEDFYSFQICFDCAKMLDVNKSDSRNRYMSLKVKFDQLTEDINRLLNFRYQEVKINTVLQELVAKVINLDVRGPGADLLLLIKDKRDSMIIEYSQKGIDGNYIENEMMETEPYFVLESNEALEERSKFLNDKIINQMLGCHPKLADYEAITQLPKVLLLKDYNSIEGGGFEPTSDIVLKIYQERVIFLLLSPKERMFMNKFKPDALLCMSKAVMYWRWSVGSKKGDHLSLNEKIAYLIGLETKPLLAAEIETVHETLVGKLISSLQSSIEEQAVPLLYPRL